MRSADGAIEIRYAIRPLSRIDISYQDPHSSAPHPNDLFKMLFDRITLQLAGTRDSFVNNYSPEQIVARFNAQWAAAALFDVDPRFSGEFRHGLLIAMHRDDQADAYVIGLFDDYDALRNHIGDLERSLRFTEPPAESTAAADS